MTETWKSIPSFPSYEASTLGRIRRSVGGKGCRAGRIIVPSKSAGYPAVRLSEAGTQRTVRVHSLVAETFLGRRPVGQEVSHLDGDRNNPQLANLVYESRSENHARKTQHGTATKGERHGRARLTPRDVIAIRLLAIKGAKHRQIAEAYGVHQKHVTAIVAKKFWSHI
jgi:hypothetical protein